MRRPPRASCGTVSWSQSNFDLNSFEKAAGIRISFDRAFGPASSSRTRVRGSVLSLLARMQPADPAPTIT
jgi:hypothetical protein